MASILFKGVQLFCSFPGATFVAPILMTLFICNPLNISILLTLVLSLYFTTNSLNNINGKKSFGSAVKWSFLFYTIISIPLWFIVAKSTCHVNNQVNDAVGNAVSYF